MPPRCGVGHEADIVCKTKVQGDDFRIPQQRLVSKGITDAEGNRGWDSRRKACSKAQFSKATETHKFSTAPLLVTAPGPSSITVGTEVAACNLETSSPVEQPRKYIPGTRDHNMDRKTNLARQPIAETSSLHCHVLRQPHICRPAHMLPPTLDSRTFCIS